ncbi:11403_t:CDS:2, partial [Scutellospora calospora]
TTSTTHLSKYLNAIYQIFSYKQYEKNLKGQTIIESDKSVQTIPSMFAKTLTIVDRYKFYRLCNEIDPCFQVPSSALNRTTIRESLIFAEDQLHNLISKMIEIFSFTTDIWTSSQYPTLSKMLLIISLLSLHLCQIKISLTSFRILIVHQQVENSMSVHWESLLIKAYIASYLESQFKNLSFVSNEKKETETSFDTLAQTEIDQFYDGKIPNYLMDDE